MKKSIFLFFAAILCASSVWAADMNSAEIYYDNTASQWSDVQLFVGKSDWNSINPMKKISNTNNLYCLYDFSWGGYSAFYFTTGTASWDPLANNENVDSRSGWATCRSAKQTANLGSTVNLYISTAATKDASVTRKELTDYKSLNYKQTVQQQLTTDGSTYSASTEAIATIKVASYRLASATATSATAQNGTIASGSSSANCEAARTATVTYSVSGINSSYSFVGWYDGDTQKSTSATYTYQATEAKTITARFAVATEEEHEVAVSYMCGTTKVADGATAYVGVETEKSFTAPTNITGYKFTNWTIGAGMTLKTGAVTDATIGVVTKSASSDYTLVANYEEVLETVYFINTGKWSDVYLHLWNGNATGTIWPGSQLTTTGENIGEYDVYSHTAKQGDHINLLFHKKDDDSKKTTDLTWSEGVDKYYIHNYNGNTGWYTKAEAEALLVTSTPEPVETTTVYFVNADDWTGTIYAYAYANGGSTKNAEWPGEVAQKEANQIGGHDVYSYTAEKDKYENVIFNNKKDGGNQQTADLTWADGAGKYYVRDNWYTKEEAEAKLAAPVVDVYTVVGSENLFGSAWTPSAEANDMEKQDDGSYKKVYSNVELTSDVIWKIAKNDNWWTGPTFNNQDNTLAIAKSGIYNVTFVLSADLATATAEAELLEETNTVADCYISGNAALTGGAGWAGNEFKMDYDPATETYSYTLTGLVTDEAYELKVVLGGSWLGYDKLQTVPTGVEDKGGNIGFKLAAAGDVVVTYNKDNGINLTGNFAEPAPEVPVTLYFVNADKWTNLKAHIWVDPSGVSYKPWEESESLTDTDNDHNGADIYSYTFSNKYNRIIWKGDDGKQTTDDVAAYDVATPYYYQGAWYATLDEIPAVVEKKYYVKGTHNEWTADATSEMTLDGEVYKKEVTLAKDVEFKINDGDKAWWGVNNLGGKVYKELEKGSDDNIKMKEEKTFTIIFNPAENLITFEDLTPAEVKCYLMGNGDWDNGVEMTLNPDNDNEYMLLDHYISAPFKFKLGDEWSDQVENYDFPGIDWDDNTNITLPEGYYDFYFKKDIKKAYIAAVYLRDVTNTWGTICLPHASTSFSGAKFYEVSSLDPTKGLWLDEIEAGAQLVAGKPYVFEATASTIKVTYTDEAVATPVEGANGLTGTFTDIAAAEDGVLVGNYIIGGNKVHVATAQNDLPANRAYIDAALVPNKVQAKIPGRRRVCMGENATTGLDQIVAPESQAVKAIVNGQLIIIRDGVKYNVQGQKL